MTQDKSRWHTVYLYTTFFHPDYLGRTYIFVFAPFFASTEHAAHEIVRKEPLIERFRAHKFKIRRVVPRAKS